MYHSATCRTRKEYERLIVPKFIKQILRLPVEFSTGDILVGLYAYDYRYSGVWIRGNVVVSSILM
jgi:hypothetical protein